MWDFPGIVLAAPGRGRNAEISSWSKPTLLDTRFVAQPWYEETNVHSFHANSTRDPNGATTHQFTREPDGPSFQSCYGSFALNPLAASIISSWAYSGADVAFGRYRRSVA